MPLEGTTVDYDLFSILWITYCPFILNLFNVITAIVTTFIDSGANYSYS